MNSPVIKYSIIGLILITAWYFLVFSPLLTEQTLIDRQSSEIYQQLSDLQSTINEVPEYLRTKESLENTKQEINSKLFGKKQILNLFKRLNLEAEDRGLTIIEITPPVSELLALNNIEDNSTEPLFLNLDIKIKGGYVSFGRYLQYLEEASFFRGIRKCQITTEAEDASELVIQIGFKALLGSPRRGV